MEQADRSSASSETSRFGYNGMLKDNDFKGEGNSYDYGARFYDPRVGRFLSLDPMAKKYPMLSPYQFASNSPISGTDLDGLEYVKANLADDKFYNQIGLVFKDETEKQAWISAHTVNYKGIDYIKLGFHVYQSTEGSFTTVKSDNTLKVSEWIYKGLTVLDSKYDHVYVWKDKTVTGTQKVKNEYGQEIVIQKNENCNELAKR
jgi:RHS repeat-associated protein